MASDKYIRVPKPIHPFDESDDRTYGLKDMVTFVVDNESRFQSPASHARKGEKILKAFDEEREEVVQLNEELHKFLNDILEKPDCGYGSWYLSNNLTKETTQLKVPTRRYLPLINAVDQASNSDPRDPAA